MEATAMSTPPDAANDFDPDGPSSGDGLFVTNFPVNGFLSYETLSALRADLIALRVLQALQHVQVRVALSWG